MILELFVGFLYGIIVSFFIFFIEFAIFGYFGGRNFNTIFSIIFLIYLAGIIMAKLIFVLVFPYVCNRDFYNTDEV